ncbi:hypothetical protein QUF70_18620, partial [Desulfobacterales bacterium HSG17]|nr:hypothetical protein [Desulfobacterales bacterium HSG17]
MKNCFVVLVILFALNNSIKAHGAELASIEIHGFISQGYLLSNENNYLADSEEGSFQFSEMGINFGKNLTDSLRLGLQIFSRDLGDTGDNEVEIDWAYGDYRWQDWLGLRAGLVKMALGLYNETRDIDLLRTCILLPQSVYIETSRDYYTRMWGAEIYGEISLRIFGSISYRFLMGTYTPDSEKSGLTKFVKNNTPFDVESVDYDNGIQYNGSLQWHTPVNGLRLSVTSWKQDNMTLYFQNSQALGPEIPANIKWETELENLATVFSAEYIWEDLIIAAEYRFRKTSSLVKNLAPEDSYKSEAYYAGAAYRITKYFELGTYYS